MLVLHISSECYPVAKVGGLADVVGALPKYQNQLGEDAKVVMPYYENAFMNRNDFVAVHVDSFAFGNGHVPYTVLKNSSLGYDLFVIQVAGIFDRPKVYGYDDDPYRALAFQLAFLDWLKQWSLLPDIIHCHDHQTGLIPFFIKHAYSLPHLRHRRTVFTIHNAEYQGHIPWEAVRNFPWFPNDSTSQMEWDGAINSLASGIRNAWRVTTVSPQYMEELKSSSNPVTPLLNYETGKCLGILNGIDTEVWNPERDKYLTVHYNSKSYKTGKAKLKEELCDQFGFDQDLPLVSFIGRFAYEKGADLLGEYIWSALNHESLAMNFLVMGSGNPDIEAGLHEMRKFTHGKFNIYTGYNEALAHKVYAGSDFMLMPSRVEPCGLNQMYAMRYGTVPIVRTVGGLLDTVKDFEDPGGVGIRFIHNSVGDVLHALKRAGEIYVRPNTMKEIIPRMMKKDLSWKKSAKEYIDLYKSIL